MENIAFFIDMLLGIILILGFVWAIGAGLPADEKTDFVLAKHKASDALRAYLETGMGNEEFSVQLDNVFGEGNYYLEINGRIIEKVENENGIAVAEADYYSGAWNKIRLGVRVG